MKDKKNKKNPITIILIIVILGLVGYICYDKGIILSKNNIKTENKKSTKKEEKSEPKIINYAIDDQNISSLIDHLLREGINSCYTLEKYANDKKVEAKDISNVIAYSIAEVNEFLKRDKESFTLDELNIAIQKYLGKDYKFDPDSIDYKGIYCPQYLYDASTKTYKKQQTACGGECGPMPMYRIIKAVDTDGILKLDVRVVFASDKSDNYYSDYAKTNVIGNFGNNVDSDYLFDQGSSKYQFTFKMENENYVFVSSEPIN